MADIETWESNQRNYRVASLTDSDLDKLLLEKDAANTRKKHHFPLTCPGWIRQVFSQCSSNDTNRVFMLFSSFLKMCSLKRHMTKQLLHSPWWTSLSRVDKS